MDHRGTVRLTIAANPGSARTGTVTIAGLSFVVEQATLCSYSLAPASRSTGRLGGPGMFNVTTSSGCSWRAVSDVPWITLSGDAGGTGNGKVDYLVQPNTTGAERRGTITVEGQSFVLIQSDS